MLYKFLSESRFLESIILFLYPYFFTTILQYKNRIIVMSEGFFKWVVEPVLWVINK